MSRWARVAWLAVGWLCFGVGAVGVAVPGLPTTGPMLLALACFARGSPRLHHWLYHHALFGPPLRRWIQHRVIPWRAKVTAVVVMSASLVAVIFFSSLPTWAVIAVASFIGLGAVIVLRIPHRRPDVSDA